MKILAISPTRISLFGGGTDVAPYCDLYGGLCINMAINIRQYLMIHNELKGYKFGQLPEGANPFFYKSFIDEFKIEDLYIDGSFDAPIESGLGASAACAVAIVAGLSKLKGQNLSKQEIAERAWDIEVNKIGLYGGRQDQYAAVFGGVNVFQFGKEVKVTQLAPGFISKVLPSFALFYLGSNRRSSKIQEGFKTLTDEQKEALDGIKELAIEGAKVLSEGDIEKVGRLFDIAWDLKKRSNKGVSNPEIDKIYEKAKKLGAYGGKIMGAGGGGHFLFVVDPAKRESFSEKIGLTETDFTIDLNGVETRRL